MGRRRGEREPARRGLRSQIGFGFIVSQSIPRLRNRTLQAVVILIRPPNLVELRESRQGTLYGVWHAAAEAGSWCRR